MTCSRTISSERDALTARAAMSTPVTVRASAPLVAVWDVMQRLHTDLVVVCDSRGALGVLDRRDVWRAWTTDLGGDRRGSGGCAVTATPSVSVDAPLTDVCAALTVARHGTVLVLDDDGTYLGVVTSEDLLAVTTRAATTC